MKDIKRAVICIDDDPMILQVLSFQMEKYLDTSDTLIELYTEPSKALSDIKSRVFDDVAILFFIVDYQMPNISGAKFIRSIKETHPAIPCIMLSGQANSSQIEALENEGLLEMFMQKPWKESDLKGCLDQIKKRYEN
ncbi:MAG: response regulator [Crocinitomicaceae bacterium]|tara:strand:+ start:5457 stop:5867 length:411 start_codon:yes stop_codon:yes gene_type:complete